MKKIIIGCIIAIELFANQIVMAQGVITYLSNVGQASTGSHAVGSDSWLAAGILTGSNAGGYMLNSVQLGMADASGNPNGFTVMIYAQNGSPGGPLPGSSLATLDGSANPSTAGIYTYTDDSNITLSPNTFYFIVLTAGTAVANGAYDWSYASTYSYNQSAGWGVTGSLPISSNQGLNWGQISGVDSQFAINATAVPEPSSEILLGLSSLAFLWHRRKTKAVL